MTGHRRQFAPPGGTDEVIDSALRALSMSPFLIAEGSTASSGLRRNALRMIWMLVTPGWRSASRASATVSTLTP